MNNNSWLVYKHIAPSDKVYIGITHLTPAQRWIRGKGYKNSILFSNAIKKYGWDNFEHKILIDKLSKEEAIEVEAQLISYYKSLGLSYNVSDGGEGYSGYHHTEEFKQKMSKLMKSRKHTSEMVEKRRQTMLLRPYHPSEETKRKIAEAARKVDHTKASHIAAKKRSKALCIVDDNGVILHEFDSQQDTAKYYGVSDAHIYHYIGKDKIPYGLDGYIKLKSNLIAQLKEE